MKTHEFLKQIIQEKKSLQPKLSLRSLAKRIGIPSGRLSELLTGKRRITSTHLEKICNALNLKPEETKKLRELHGQENDELISKGYSNNLLTPSQISMLTDWKLFAIMSFLQTSTYEDLSIKNPSQEDQIQALAQKTGTSVHEIRCLLDVMTQAQLIEWHSVRWRPCMNTASSGYDVPSDSIRAGHATNLELAKKKLFEHDVTKRDFSSITMSINPEDLPKAKKMIRSFRRQFAESLEKNKKTDVYQISIQFFPVIESNQDSDSITSATDKTLVTSES